MMNVTLSKITGGERIRTDTVTGTCHKLPEVGESFEMLSAPIVPGAIGRVIVTSTVQSVATSDDVYLVRTLNSVYHLVID